FFSKTPTEDSKYQTSVCLFQCAKQMVNLQLTLDSAFALEVTSFLMICNMFYVVSSAQGN
ncbi:hypothetical protein FRX31_012996, partial [Thalictrum thalictroides]